MPELDDAEIARRLLHHLTRAFGCADAAYVAGPVRIQGGLDTTIFGFTLERAAPPLQGPLILRLSHANADPARVKLETVVQNTLAEMGFPAPRVMVTESDPAILGGPFMVMGVFRGRPWRTVSRALALAAPCRSSCDCCSIFRPFSAASSTSGSRCRSACISCRRKPCCGP